MDQIHNKMFQNAITYISSSTKCSKNVDENLLTTACQLRAIKSTRLRNIYIYIYIPSSQSLTTASAEIDATTITRQMFSH